MPITSCQMTAMRRRACGSTRDARGISVTIPPTFGMMIVCEVTFAALLGATPSAESGSRRFGWQSMVLGSVVATMDLAFLGFAFYLSALRLPKHAVGPLIVFLLFFAGTFLAKKSSLSFKEEQKRTEPDVFSRRIKSLPLTKDGFSFAFWPMMAFGLPILLVWLAISLIQGWPSSTLGVFLGMTAMGFWAHQAKLMGLQARPSSLYSLSAGIVLAYAAFFFRTVIG